MIQFKGTKVFGFENAVIGARLPMCLSYEEAVSKSDSKTENNVFVLGANDLKLLSNLIHADSKAELDGQPNSKFLRMIHVQTCITAPCYFASELDTYKVGTVRNSSSLMHKGMSKEYTIDDFETDEWTENADYWHSTLENLNRLRKEYLETKSMKTFRELRQNIPMSYKYTFMWDCDYATLRNIYAWRCKVPHRLKEWSVQFKEWIESLPYGSELLV